MPTKNRVDSIGLELEGGWSYSPPGLKRDGSVTGLRSDYIGEISSDPIKTIDVAERWLRTYYPQEVHASCGFHVHVGLKPLHYSRLMDEEFNAKFLAAMEDFHERNRASAGFELFRHRLDGQNVYCQKLFRPEAQLWRTEHYGDHHVLPRYSQLNYCFGRHGTLECRLFPCFPSAAHAVEAMKAFVNCINEFLANAKAERPIAFTIRSDELRAPSARAVAASV